MPQVPLPSLHPSPPAPPAPRNPDPTEISYTAYSPSPSSLAAWREKKHVVQSWARGVDVAPHAGGRALRPVARDADMTLTSAAAPTPAPALTLGSLGQSVGVGSADWSETSASSGTAPTELVERRRRERAAEPPPRPAKTPPVPLLAKPPLALGLAAPLASPDHPSPGPGHTRAAREAYIASALSLPLDILSEVSDVSPRASRRDLGPDAGGRDRLRTPAARSNTTLASAASTSRRAKTKSSLERVKSASQPSPGSDTTVVAAAKWPLPPSTAPRGTNESFLKPPTATNLHSGRQASIRAPPPQSEATVVKAAQVPAPPSTATVIQATRVPVPPSSATIVQAARVPVPPSTATTTQAALSPMPPTVAAASNISLADEPAAKSQYRPPATMATLDLATRVPIPPTTATVQRAPRIPVSASTATVKQAARAPLPLSTAASPLARTRRTAEIESDALSPVHAFEPVNIALPPSLTSRAGSAAISRLPQTAKTHGHLQFSPSSSSVADLRATDEHVSFEVPSGSRGRLRVSLAWVPTRANRARRSATASQTTTPLTSPRPLPPPKPPSMAPSKPPHPEPPREPKSLRPPSDEPNKDTQSPPVSPDRLWYGPQFPQPFLPPYAQQVYNASTPFGFPQPPWPSAYRPPSPLESPRRPPSVDPPDDDPAPPQVPTYGPGFGMAYDPRTFGNPNWTTRLRGVFARPEGQQTFLPHQSQAGAGESRGDVLSNQAPSVRQPMYHAPTMMPPMAHPSTAPPPHAPTVAYPNGPTVYGLPPRKQPSMFDRLLLRRRIEDEYEYARRPREGERPLTARYPATPTNQHVSPGSRRRLVKAVVSGGALGSSRTG
ncbi:hypothetical protein Q5752_006729 [Cryptotrichosporon argae]